MIDYVPGVDVLRPKDMTSYLQDSDTTSVVHQIINNAFQDVRSADFVLCNTVQELEKNTISALKSKLPFYGVGPIFPTAFCNSTVSTSLWSESDCSQWLSSKPDGSVLYVSFGSYSHVTKRDLAEIAKGVSQSNVTFVWVLRPDIVSSKDLNPLPSGFKEEVANRGLIIPWCRQNAVLAHPAIGGFLTHCGWNSILESTWCEVPLLCFPLYTDQFTNRKLVVDDWKTGISLGDLNLVTKREVSEKINRLMSEETGREFKNAAKQVKKTLQDALKPQGSSQTNMDQFIKDLEAKIETRSGSQK